MSDQDAGVHTCALKCCKMQYNAVKQFLGECVCDLQVCHASFFGIVSFVVGHFPDIFYIIAAVWWPQVLVWLDIFCLFGEIRKKMFQTNPAVSRRLAGLFPQTCLQGIHTFCVASIPDSADRGPIDPEMYSKLCSFQEYINGLRQICETVCGLHTKNKPGSKADFSFAHQ